MPRSKPEAAKKARGDAQTAAARERKFTPAQRRAIVEDVCRQIAEMKSIRNSVLRHDISPATFLEWVYIDGEDGDCAKLYARARQMRLHLQEDALLGVAFAKSKNSVEATDNARAQDALKFALGRLHRDYKLKTDVTSKDQPVGSVLILPDDGSA